MNASSRSQRRVTRAHQGSPEQRAGASLTKGLFAERETTRAAQGGGKKIKKIAPGLAFGG